MSSYLMVLLVALHDDVYFFKVLSYICIMWFCMGLH